MHVRRRCDDVPHKLYVSLSTQIARLMAYRDIGYYCLVIHGVTRVFSVCSFAHLTFWACVTVHFDRLPVAFIKPANTPDYGYDFPFLQDLPGCDSTFRNVDWKYYLNQTACAILDDGAVKWFPEYGCAVLAMASTPASDSPPAFRSLSVVGLDKWALDAHWIRSPR